ncbi:hypothetical protein E2562_029642, partial [Oryza meyeriana var. granulata]
MAPPPMPPCSRTPPTPPPSRTPPATLIGRTTLPPQGISASNDATALGAHRYRYTEAALETEDEHGFPYQYNPRLQASHCPGDLTLPRTRLCHWSSSLLLLYQVLCLFLTHRWLKQTSRKTSKQAPKGGRWTRFQW